MYLKLTFHGVSFYATLLEDKAPILCAELKKACPFEARLTYAKYAITKLCSRRRWQNMWWKTPCIL